MARGQTRDLCNRCQYSIVTLVLTTPSTVVPPATIVEGSRPRQTWTPMPDAGGASLFEALVSSAR